MRVSNLMLNPCTETIADMWDCRSLTTSGRTKKSGTLCLEGRQQEWRRLLERQLGACSSVWRRAPHSGTRGLPGELYVGFPDFAVCGFGFVGCLFAYGLFCFVLLDSPENHLNLMALNSKNWRREV